MYRHDYLCVYVCTCLCTCRPEVNLKMAPKAHLSQLSYPTCAGAIGTCCMLWVYMRAKALNTCSHFSVISTLPAESSPATHYSFFLY